MVRVAVPLAECCLKDHGFSTAIVERANTVRYRGTPCVREVADSFGRGQQAERVTELKCLHRSPKGDRAARKGISGLLPGVESWSSEVRVSDGMLKPNPEDSLHYGLLLGDGDINNRGEDVEEFNTLVCRLCGSKSQGVNVSQNRACAKADPFRIKKAPAGSGGFIVIHCDRGHLATATHCYLSTAPHYHTSKTGGQKNCCRRFRNSIQTVVSDLQP